jgi:hypothetical protein
MGAWGHETFENDWALDWVFTLEESEDFSAIEETLANINTTEEWPEDPACCEARAAAEVVAALRGKPATILPDEVQTWLKGKPMPTKAWVAAATKALDRIMTDSEAKAQWEETEYYAAWKTSVEELRSRLA